MAIFYRGPCVLITHEVFQSHCPSERAYPIRDLCQLRVVQRYAPPPPGLVVARTGSTSAAGTTAVVAAIGWAEGWHVLESAAGVLAVMVILLVVVTAAGACWRARPIEQDLLATYRGEPVSLFRSADDRVFGQVQRGLTRSLERHGDAPG